MWTSSEGTCQGVTTRWTYRACTTIRTVSTHLTRVLLVTTTSSTVPTCSTTLSMYSINLVLWVLIYLSCDQSVLSLSFLIQVHLLFSCVSFIIHVTYQISIILSYFSFILYIGGFPTVAVTFYLRAKSYIDRSICYR